MDDPNHEHSGNFSAIEYNVVAIREVPQTRLKSIRRGPCVWLSGINAAVAINVVDQSIGSSWTVASHVIPDLVEIVLGRQTEIDASH